MVLMPDSPAVSFAQLSVLPAPSEVTTPRPVTTTIGRPNLSLPAAIVRYSSADAFDQRKTFAAPMPDAGHQNLLQISSHRPFQAGRVTRRIQPTMAQCDRSQCDIDGELRLHPMAEI